MLIERLFDDRLAQASYLLGCQATGTALVVDPTRDIVRYVDAAAAHRMRITHVTETHIHADYASGARELADRVEARLLLSGAGGADWQYGFTGAYGTTLVADGDSFLVGNLRVDVVHVPGHTPEHIALVVTDTPATDRPVGVFTGDFVFVGDVGRPDLLERAANVSGSMDVAARALHASLRRFATMPDHVQLWPGHGAGSACGKALGAMPSTTLGYERIANWAFRHLDDEETFVREVLAGQPEPPAYFARMKRLNRDGVPTLAALPMPQEMPPHDVFASGAALLDLRPMPEYAAAHVSRAIGVPIAGKSFTSWAGSVVDYDRDLILVLGDSQRIEDAADAARELALIGFDRVRGWVRAGRLHHAAGETHAITQADARDVAARLEGGEIVVLDVRNPGEWAEGHIPGARHVPLGALARRLLEVPRGRPIVVQCLSGSRSAVAAGVLDAAGYGEVTNLSGGITAWRAAGLPIVRDP